MTDLDKFRTVLDTFNCKYDVFLECKMSRFEITVYSLDDSYMGSIYFNLDGSLWFIKKRLNK